MMDRYEANEYVLELEQRAGYEFVILAEGIYLDFSHVPHARQVKLKEKLKSLRSAMDELEKVWRDADKLRPNFAIPAHLKKEYHDAKSNWQYLKANREDYYKKQQADRDVLITKKNKLEEKIEAKQIKLARAEDWHRHEKNKNKEQVNAEIESLKNQKHHCEELKKELDKKFILFRSKKNKQVAALPTIIESIQQKELELQKIDRQSYQDLDEKREHLELLRNHLWFINQELNKPVDNHAQLVELWQKEVADAKSSMLDLSKDIDGRINEYFSRESQQIMHAFLNVYAFIQEIAALPININFQLKDKIEQLAVAAEKLHCPERANRTLLTFYKNLTKLSVAERNQVIYQKPEKDKLPEALQRTFSDANLARTASTLGLFKRVQREPSLKDLEKELVEITKNFG